jgi:hypothetical protein
VVSLPIGVGFRAHLAEAASGCDISYRRAVADHQQQYPYTLLKKGDRHVSNVSSPNGEGLQGTAAEKISTRGPRGSRYVERLLTVAATCRLQGRQVLKYLTSACEAGARG